MRPGRRAVKRAERIAVERDEIATQLIEAAARCRLVFEERDELIHAALLAGFTQAEVSRLCDLSTARIAQIVAGNGGGNG